MFNQKYFGIPGWIWLIIITITLLTSYQTILNKTNQENKEPFADAKYIAQVPSSSSNNALSIIKIYNFNTSWCGWSQRFQQPWSDFTNYVNNKSNNLTNIQAIDIKCDNPINKDMCDSFNVPGYPYIIVEQNGKRTPYQGERTVEALIAYAKTL